MHCLSNGDDFFKVIKPNGFYCWHGLKSSRSCNYLLVMTVCEIFYLTLNIRMLMASQSFKPFTGPKACLFKSNFGHKIPLFPKHKPYNSFSLFNIVFRDSYMGEPSNLVPLAAPHDRIDRC